MSQFYIKYISYKWRWTYGNIIGIVNILIFRVSNYNLFKHQNTKLLPGIKVKYPDNNCLHYLFIFMYFHISSIIYNIKKISLSLKICNFHWKIQKFKNPFFIIPISFSINFKQFFFFVFHTFFSHLLQLFIATSLLLAYTNPLKKSKSIPITVLKFCLLQVCDIIRTDARTHGRTHRRTFGSQYLESA